MRGLNKIVWSIGILVVMLLAIAPASPAAQSSSHIASLASHADVFPGDGGSAPERYTYDLDTTGLAANVARTGQLDLNLGRSVQTAKLTERTIYVAGTTPTVDIHAFQGTLKSDPSGTVGLVISPTGIYGGVDFQGSTYSLEPSKGTIAAGIIGKEEVVIHDHDVLARIAPVLPVLNPTSSAQSGNWHLNIQPYTDPAYRSYASDYESRIAGAYNYVNSMWISQTHIYYYLYPSTPLSSPMTYGGCGESGVSDNGLGAFTSYMSGHARLGPNIYVYFTADQDPGRGVAGCGNIKNLQPYNGLWYQADDAVQGKDWWTIDSYDPDESAHLGLTAGHEATHNLGEDIHPDDSHSSCDYNIMSSGHTFWCTNAWLPASSVTKVQSWAETGRLQQF